MTTRQVEVLIGMDLGTSGLKTVASLPSGEVVARASASYPTSRPEELASEQDPADWLSACRSALSELADAVPTRHWQGIGLSAMIPTLVTTDDYGTPIGNAITWEDGRAERHGAALREMVGADRLYGKTGQWLDGRYLLPMLLRLKDCEPARLRRTSWLLGAKDYLFWHLTRTRATDPSTAAGFGCYGLRTGAWLPDVLASSAHLLGSPMPGLPKVSPATHTAPLVDAASENLGVPAGIPVAVGAADSVLAAKSLGVRDNGDAAYVAGTSTVILGMSDELVLDEAHRFLVTPMAEPGGWGIEMDLLATGSAVHWLSGLLGVTDAELVAMADRSDHRGAPLFLPYLAPGEQGALWDPSLTGTITGLSLHHDRAHLARALVTGLVLESRRCLDVLGEVTRVPGKVRVAGSSAASVGFHQDLADASGRSVIGGEPSVDHSAVGAALVAASAVGLVRGSVSDEPEAVRSPQKAVLPRPERQPMWRELARRHDQALAAFRGLAAPQ
jgi:sugar (pentulose or hexulose) kinase